MGDKHKIRVEVLDIHIDAKCERISDLLASKGIRCKYRKILFMKKDYIRFNLLHMQKHKYVNVDISYGSLLRFNPNKIVKYMLNEFKWE